MLSSHDCKLLRSISTLLKRRFWQGNIHDFATSEQLRSDCLSSLGIWPITSSSNSNGRFIVTSNSPEMTWIEKMRPGGACVIDSRCYSQVVISAEVGTERRAAGGRERYRGISVFDLHGVSDLYPVGSMISGDRSSCRFPSSPQLARMYLPEELLDEIFSHLPSDRGRSLMSCSLVAKSWLEPSRRLLFAHISIRRDNYRSWLDNIQPRSTGLLRYARSLTYFLRAEDGASRLYCVHALRHYFPSFCQLRTLTFCNVVVEPTIHEHLGLFSAFQHMLSSLSLARVSITWSAFVTLVGYFPHLRNLNIRSPSFRVDDIPVPQLPRPLRGRLIIEPFRGDGMDFFSQLFPELRPEHEELVIFGAYNQHLAVSLAGSLRLLKIYRCERTSLQCVQYRIGTSADRVPLPSVDTEADLSRCSQLRQLEIVTTYPQEQERILISSIASTNLERIILKPFNIQSLQSFLDDPCWIPFDNMLYGFVDRLRSSGLKYTLEVEFQLTFVEFSGEVYHGDFLPMFKEKGLVRMANIFSGKVREWPSSGGLECPAKNGV
jgi:hypothetical protein